MAFDFSVACQCLSKRTIGFFMDQTPRPFLTYLIIKFLINELFNIPGPVRRAVLESEID
jgi:hypothetical protein